MEFLIVNRTKDMCGAHGTTMLVNDFVNKRLAEYGGGVEEVSVELLYPPKSRPRTPSHLTEEFWQLVDRSPRVTFFRRQRRIEIRTVCPDISAKSILGAAHLKFAEVELLVGHVSQALEDIRSRVKPADQFDVDRFLADAQQALAQCPARIKRWLG